MDSCRQKQTADARSKTVESCMTIRQFCVCRCYVQFEYLEDVLRDGQLPPEAVARCPLVTDVFADNGGQAAAFARGMTGATLGTPFIEMQYCVDAVLSCQLNTVRWHAFLI